MSSPDADRPPPVGRWTRLVDASNGSGYLSVYLSEPLARYPIRHVTRPADNKSDPNIETATFGLFSTCERIMRAKIVREGRPYLYFVTTHGRRARGRALAGYYDLSWYAPSIGGAASGDYALAASKIRFVDPIPLDELPEPARSVCLPGFRTMRPIKARIASVLHRSIDDRPDRTENYLSELQRIEQFSLHHSGYAYPSWGQAESFSWGLAGRFMCGPDTLGTVSAGPSTSGQWRCTACRRIITSKALLKSCPVCKSMGTLSPLNEQAGK